MGGSSSSRHISVESEEAEGVVFVKGIRVTDRVIDRMREPSPVQHPQSKSSTCPPAGQPSSPQSKTTELLAPILPHPPSYASTLVPPPVQEPISPLVPLVSVTQETSAPPQSTHTGEAVPSGSHDSESPESVPAPVPSAQEPIDSERPALPAEPISKSPLTFTDSGVMPLPVLSTPFAEAVDSFSGPPPVSDTVTSPPPSEPQVTSTEAPAVSLTEKLTAPMAEAIHLTTTVEPTEMHMESTSLSAHILTLDASIPVEQEELPTGTEIGMPLSPDAAFSTPTESAEISQDVPLGPVKPSNLPSDLEDLLPPPTSAVLTAHCEVPLMGQIGSAPSEDTLAPAPAVEPAVAPVLPALSETLGLFTSPQAVVNEEELRKQIRAELQKHLQEEMNMAKLKIQKQLEEEKAKAKAEAEAEAQQQIQAKVQKVREKEQLSLQQNLKNVIIQERKSIRDEQLASQYYWMERKMQKLEEKERDLAKQDSMYKDQVARLEGKTGNFTRVTADSFKKGLEDTNIRFKRYQIKPVCSELQSEILKCYLKNTGQTLTCSRIASQYVECVHNAKQNKKVSTGG